MLFKSLLIAATASVAAAQGVGMQIVRVGMLGNGTTGNFFSPDRVVAPVGSVVQFQFLGGNHTVTQSTFDGSCIPISTTNTSATGFYSGFVPAANSLSKNQVALYNVQITATNPIWVYCSQGRHCQSGMAMVINENPTANSTRTLEQYKIQASAVQQAGVPTISPGVGGVSGTGTIDPNNPQATQTQPGAAAGLQVPMALLAALAAGVMLF